MNMLLTSTMLLMSILLTACLQINAGSLASGVRQCKIGRGSADVRFVCLSKGTNRAAICISETPISSRLFGEMLAFPLLDSYEMPIDNATWVDGMLFCERATRNARALGSLKPDEAFRLPTRCEYNEILGDGCGNWRPAEKINNIAFVGLSEWTLDVSNRIERPTAWLYCPADNGGHFVLGQCLNGEQTTMRVVIGAARDMNGPSFDAFNELRVKLESGQLKERRLTIRKVEAGP